jgi:GNAT superfamily N-acetyltransferase
MASGTAFGSRDFTGVALWLDPETGPDEEEIGRLVEESVAAEKRADFAAVIEQMGGFHPQEPHWYLPFVAVDPTRQGGGLGTALLGPILARCDAERKPAYLESTNPRNQTLYERLGFRALGKIRAGQCPPIVPMLRQPV